MFRQSILLRYWSVGGMASVIHFAVFLLLLTVTTPTIATVCGGVSGAVVSFYANKQLTFITDNAKTLNSQRFYLVAIAYNLASAALMYGIEQYSSIDALYFWALVQIIVTLSLSVASFFIHKHWSYHYV